MTASTELGEKVEAYAATLPDACNTDHSYQLGVLLALVAGEPPALAAVLARIEANTASAARRAVSS